MFRTKICGVTTVEDAEATIEAGADAIGLNFHEPSPRSVSLEQARAICDVLPERIERIGVFVDADIDQMLTAADVLRLDWIQLHGNESPDVPLQLDPFRVIRAFRSKDQGFAPLLEDLVRTREYGAEIQAVLVDAYEPGAYGGTGKVVDWNSVAQLGEQLPATRVVLAGGLTPENVAEAIRVARPTSVDTASGVESRPGRKDVKRLRDFIANARAAFAALGVDD